MSKESSSGARVGSSGGFLAKASSLSRSHSKRLKAHTSSIPALPLPPPVEPEVLRRPPAQRNDPSFSGSVGTNQSSTSGTEIDARHIGLRSPSTTSGPPTAHPTAADAKTQPDMLVAPFGNNLKREPTLGKGAGSQYTYTEHVYGTGGMAPGGMPAPTMNPSVGNSQNPHVLYQYIHDMASKRISTLDYLRKAHEGRVYWFNTLHFSKSDLTRIPYFDPRKLTRRATNYLLLGLSLPTILDLNSSSPLEYLRALNALLVEFEAFQQVHPPDGSTSSSLSRARIPQMFKRATHNKSRRTSSATEIGLPMQSSDPSEIKSLASGSMASYTASSSSISSFPSSAESSELLPGEEYVHLLTPSLPFDPDFYETFATLCDVLIDCYTRIISLISSPTLCSPAVGEVFGKADARLRKIMVAGVVREFEDASRTGAKSELAGVGKVVLDGLMGS